MKKKCSHTIIIRYDFGFDRIDDIEFSDIFEEWKDRGPLGIRLSVELMENIVDAARAMMIDSIRMQCGECENQDTSLIILLSGIRDIAKKLVSRFRYEFYLNDLYNPVVIQEILAGSIVEPIRKMIENSFSEFGAVIVKQTEVEK